MGKPLLIVIAGPTASGKTATAIQLAEYFGTEVISADSRQIYRELRIGVARPTADELARVLHHGIASRSITEPYSAAQFEQDALQLLQTLFKTRDIVIVCGGTGLYIQALLEGIEDSPALSPEESQRIRNLTQEEQLTTLLKLDPDAANIIDTRNPRRVQRALEQVRATGKPLRTLRTGAKAARPFNAKVFILDPDKEILELRMAKRIDQMFADGLVDEARLVYPWKHLPAVQTVGYQELFPYFEGKITLEAAREQIRINTRRYAKRQRTWLRNRMGGGVFIQTDNSESALPLILQELNKHHGN
jgi:tRNA dimethylallyltransferase